MTGRIPTALAGVILAGCMSLSPEQLPPQAPLRFVCDRSDSFLITFADDRAILQTGGKEVVLKSEPTASGFAYSGEGHSVRGKGPELSWTKPDGTKRSCREEKWAMQQPQIQPPAPAAITDGRWILVSFQSSDDAVGTVIPPNVEKYILALAKDGRLLLQLDCSRATGSWRITSQSASGGSLELRGGAMTRAMCGPGAIDTRIARDLSRISSYALRGDRLFLALEADGGIYEFRRE